MPSRYVRGGVSVRAERGFVVYPPTVYTWASKGTEQYAWGDYVTTGNNIPDWKRRIAINVSATTSLTGERYDVKADGGYWSYLQYDKTTKQYTDTFRRGLMGYLPAMPNATSLSETKANNSALSRLVKSITSAQRHLQGSVALGELGETLAMIRNPAMSIRKGLDTYLDTVKKRVRRRRPGSGGPIPLKDRGRIIADTWLEHAFGWRPLFGDVRTAAEALARRRHEWRREIVKVRGGGSNTNSTCTGLGSALYGYLVGYTNSVTIDDVNVKYYGAVKREVYNDYKWDMKLFGFDPVHDFLPTVWELIPYSFLVDYFTNVSDIIDGFSVNRASVCWLNKGVRKYSRLTANWRLDPSYAQDQLKNSATKTYIGYQERSPRLELRHVVVGRIGYTGTLVPTLEFTIPGLGTKWVNIAALAAGHADARKAVRMLG